MPPGKAKVIADPLVEVVVGGSVVHGASLVHLRKGDFSNISNGSLRGLKL
jgi:hypothetical protein